MAAGLIWYTLPEESIIALAFLVITAVGYLVLIPASIASIVAFHKDARYLRESGAEWVPKPWHWTILGIFLSPPVAAVGYTYERNRQHGVPWADLLFWRAG